MRESLASHETSQSDPLPPIDNTMKLRLFSPRSQFTSWQTGRFAGSSASEDGVLGSADVKILSGVGDTIGAEVTPPYIDAKLAPLYVAQTLWGGSSGFMSRS
eukprot:scaffold475_cov279-Pinguiococcus_pyrenoidosus.AAC.6